MTRVFPYLFLLVACAPDVPAQPTWVDDVGPILKANCVRCHGVPATGGAALAFRLDRFRADLLRAEGRQGARTMAPFVAHRAGERGDMPPNGPQLTDRQKQILIRWADSINPEGGAGNSPPSITVVEPIVNDNTTVTINYFVEDADGDGVVGSLYVGSNMPGNLVSDALHGGRGTVAIDTGRLATGTYPVLVEIDDGIGATVSQSLGMVDVTNATVAPKFDVAIVREIVGMPDVFEEIDVVRAAEQPLIQITIDDGDSTAWTGTVVAVRGTKSVALASGVAIPVSNPLPASLDVSGLSPASSWRLHVTIEDEAQNVRTAITDPFIISDSTTTLTWTNDIQPIVNSRCLGCHSTFISFDLTHTNFSNNRGLVWRRVVQKREMPPKSAATFLGVGYTPISDDERATLSEWLLGGAPL